MAKIFCDIADLNLIKKFHKIKIVGEDKSGLWVTGLPEEVSIITVGQEYVAPGQLIEPINIPRSDE